MYGRQNKKKYENVSVHFYFLDFVSKSTNVQEKKNISKEKKWTIKKLVFKTINKL